MTFAIRRPVAQALNVLSGECSSLANRLIENAENAEARRSPTRLKIRWSFAVAALLASDASSWLAERAAPTL